MPLNSLRRRALVLIFAAVGGAASLNPLCPAQSAKGPDLNPELREMLARDSKCETTGAAAGTDNAHVDQGAAARTPVSEDASGVQTIHNSRGQNVGIIARVENACHCSAGNCTTLVYLKSGQSYRLALKENLASLRPLKGFKESMPALSGKLQVSDSAAETIIYEWESGEYRAGICATVLQENGRPVITKHPCAKIENSVDKP